MNSRDSQQGFWFSTLRASKPWSVQYGWFAGVVSRAKTSQRVFYAYLQASEETSKALVEIKNLLYGTAEQDPKAEMVAQLAQEMYHNNMLYMLVQNLHKIDFEVIILFLSWQSQLIWL